MLKNFKENYINLASARLGAQAIYATDDFFAPKERLLHDTDPVFIDDKYDEHGKWMDGWESRRKREPGHDYCDIRLARPGYIHGVVINTTHFTGNYPPEFSIQACNSVGEPDENTEWITVIKKSTIKGDDIKTIRVDDNRLYSHVRLHIYPDGGVARLQIYGIPQCNWESVRPDERKDLGCALNGGRAIACSDEHFGKMDNLLLPDKGLNMGDGWETARRRGPGYDWVVIALGHTGMLKKIVIDTAYFKGNYPDSCSIQGACISDESLVDDMKNLSENWTELLPKYKLEMDREHQIADEILDIGVVSHIRLNIYPDGGISRLRLMGTIDHSLECENAKINP